MPSSSLERPLTWPNLVLEIHDDCIVLTAHRLKVEIIMRLEFTRADVRGLQIEVRTARSEVFKIKAIDNLKLQLGELEKRDNYLKESSQIY